VSPGAEKFRHRRTAAEVEKTKTKTQVIFTSKERKHSMNTTNTTFKLSLTVAAFALSCAFAVLADAPVRKAQYQQLNLIGYQQGMGRHTDPKLNGWGMAFAPDGPFCVANTATGVATFYDRSGKPLPVVITVPAAPSQPFGPVGSPTGVAYNPTSDFVISKNGKSGPAVFVFDTLDGTLSG